MKWIVQALLTCTIVQAIELARPGAIWSLKDNDYSQLNWQDATQSKPTIQELQTALATCRTNEANRVAAKKQARLDVKNISLTQTQRLQALLILLDYDQ